MANNFSGTLTELGLPTVIGKKRKLSDLRFVWQNPAEATAVAPQLPPDTQTGFQAAPQQETAGRIQIQPRTFSIENPAFYDQTPEQQKRVRSLMQVFGYDRVVAEGLQPPTHPRGAIVGAARAFAGGITGAELAPTVDANPTLEFLGSMSGEALKYGTLYKILPKGLPSAAKDLLAGALSGSMREAQKEKPS